MPRLLYRRPRLAAPSVPRGKSAGARPTLAFGSRSVGWKDEAQPNGPKSGMATAASNATEKEKSTGTSAVHRRSRRENETTKTKGGAKAAPVSHIPAPQIKLKLEKTHSRSHSHTKSARTVKQKPSTEPEPEKEEQRFELPLEPLFTSTNASEPTFWRTRQRYIKDAMRQLQTLEYVGSLDDGGSRRN